MFFIRWSTKTCKTDTIDETKTFCKLCRTNKAKSNHQFLLLVLGDNDTNLCMKNIIFNYAIYTIEQCIVLMFNSVSQTDKSIPESDMKTDIIGGDPGFIAKLSMFYKYDVKENARTFSQWSGSLKYYPRIIKSKVGLKTNVNIWSFYT